MPPAVSVKKYALALAGLLATAIIFLHAPRAHATIGFVQSASGFSSASTASLQATFGAGTAAGDLVVVAIGYQSTDSTNPPSTITDDKGDVYTLALGPSNGFSNYFIATYYAKNVAAGAKAVTLSLGAAETFVRLAIHEYSGMDTVSPFDAASASAAGAGSNPDSNAATTTFSDELIFAWCPDANGAVTAGTGFAQRVSVGAEITEDKIVNAAGAYNATCGGDNSAWAIQMSAFKAAGATAPQAVPISFVQGSASFAAVSVAGTTTSITFANPSTAHDLIVVAAGWSNTGANASVTDDAGNTYTSAIVTTSAGLGYRTGIFYAKNVAGGGRTITITVGASASFIRLIANEYANADTVAPQDGTSSATGSGVLADTGSATTASANDLLFGWCISGVLTEAPGQGFMQSGIAGSEIVEEGTSGAAGTYNATCHNPNGAWMASLAAFRPEQVPPSTGTLTATSIGQTSVTLTASGGSDSGSGLAAAPYVFQNLTTGATSGATSSLTWTDAGLTAGTSYSYRLTVSDIAGNSASTSTSATTQSIPNNNGGGSQPAPAASQSVSGGGPIAMPLLINGGASITTNPNVTLSFRVSSAMPFRAASAQPALDAAPLMPYTSSVSWQLCSASSSCPPGDYAVYVRFYENGTPALTVSSSIMLVAQNGSETTTMPSACTMISIIPPSRPFTVDLSFGSFAPAVRRLQQFLNTNGFTLAATGAGSPGNETEYFGVRTMNALMKFKSARRADIGLTTTTGSLDAKTRQYINNAASCFAIY